MKKIKLSGISRRKGRIKLRFRKSEAFVQFIEKVTEEYAGKPQYDIYYDTLDKNGKAKYFKIGAGDYCNYWKHGKLQMDMFVGQKVIIVVIRAPEKENNKIYRIMEKYMSFTKPANPKKGGKIPEYTPKKYPKKVKK